MLPQLKYIRRQGGEKDDAQYSKAPSITKNKDNDALKTVEKMHFKK